MNDEPLMRLARRLRPTDPEACAEELRQDPAFQGDLSWLERVFAAADFMPVADVPAGLHDRLLGLFTAAETSPSRVRVENAVQIQDSREAGDYAGVRGTVAPVHEGWSLLFSAPSADLLIDVVASRGNPSRVSGHLLPRNGERVAFQVVGAALEEPVFGDEHNTFTLGDFEDGEYSFRLEGDRVAIAWTMVLDP